MYRACAHSLRRQGPIPSIPVALVGSRDVKASKTSELVMVKSQIVEAGVDKVSRGGSSKQLCVKIEWKYELKSDALSESAVPKTELNSTVVGIELSPVKLLMCL